MEALLDRISAPRLELLVRRLHNRDTYPLDGEVDERKLYALLEEEGISPKQAVLLLTPLVSARMKLAHSPARLVLSPPGYDGVDARDTSLVIQELFKGAQQHALVVTFAMERQIGKMQGIFSPLAQKLDADPSFEMELFVNIHREFNDTTPADALRARFLKAFRAGWPGTRRPALYHDPRSVELGKHAVLHAKLVVIDRKRLFVTSANFTEAAQERNIEAGVLIDDPHLALSVIKQFQHLRGEGRLTPVS